MNRRGRKKVKRSAGEREGEKDTIGYGGCGVRLVLLHNRVYSIER